MARVSVCSPDGSVVVEEVGQVVGHQVLSRDSQVDRVPVLELPPHGLQLLPGDPAFGRQRRVLEEDEIPDFVGHLLRADLESVVAAVASEGVALQEVRDAVVGHVDGRVGQRLDQPTLVPEEQIGRSY